MLHEYAMPYIDNMKYMYIIIMLQSTAYQTDEYLSFSDQAHKTKEQHECKYCSNTYAATVIIILIYYYIVYCYMDRNLLHTHSNT